MFDILDALIMGAFGILLFLLLCIASILAGAGLFALIMTVISHG